MLVVISVFFVLDFPMIHIFSVVRVRGRVELFA